MSVSCYVYYRVSPDHAGEAHAAAQDIQRRLKHMTRTLPRLLAKIDEPLLYMEVYEDIRDSAAFSVLMKACEEHTGIRRWLAGNGERHVEMFRCA